MSDPARTAQIVAFAGLGVAAVSPLLHWALRSRLGPSRRARVWAAVLVGVPGGSLAAAAWAASVGGPVRSGWHPLVAALALVVAVGAGHGVSAGVLLLADGGRSGVAVVTGSVATGAAGSTATVVAPAAPLSGAGPASAPAPAAGQPAGPADARVLRGGAWIGMLERVAVVLSLLGGEAEGVAIALAVKSLGRYPELRSPVAAERFIIGTFASVLWAAATATTAVLLLG
ncbi:MAG: hypothetical protein U0Q15_20660 [Kineosporiaceae bacterium]